VVERAVAEIERHALDVSDVEPRLVHGDFGPKHIFVDHEQITGIIDWGEARSDDPVEDFAWWNFWHRGAAPLAWLIEGYEDRSLFDATFALRLQVAQLCLGLQCLEYYDGQGYRWGIEFSLRNLVETLQQFV
jgi:aminoglycoside phosphotransferase (APT) family kinase protein